MHPFLRYAIEKQRDIVSVIREFVECESPSDSPAAINRFCDLVIERTKDIAQTKIYESPSSGHHLRLEFRVPGTKKSGQILGLGHADTVWPLGTLAQIPFREESGRLWGPGVFDMKAGLAFFIFAARTLRDLDRATAKIPALL